MSTNAAELIGLSAWRMAEGIAARRFSARDVVEAHIRRIEEVDPVLNAVVVPQFEQAMDAASQADERQARGEPLKPLHGVPITVKELLDLQGTPTTAGLTARAGHRAAVDAAVVQDLKRAGAIVLGKTNVPTLAISVCSENRLYGRTNNPWDARRGAGGSSSGEAALIAACGSPLGLGSDGGGSIRNPCHSCGICGIKPTGKRLSMQGHWLAPNFHDDWVQAGPMARCVADLELALEVLSRDNGASRADVCPVPLRKASDVSLSSLRVGVYSQLGWISPSPAVARATRDAVEALAAAGAHVEPFEPPAVEEAWRLYFSIFLADGLRNLKRQMRRSRFDRHLWPTWLLSRAPTPLRSGMSKVLAALGERGFSDILRFAPRRLESVASYQSLLASQQSYRQRFAEAMRAARLDAIVCPPSPVAATPHGESNANFVLLYTLVYNLLSMPAGVLAATRVRPDEQHADSRGRGAIERCYARTEEESAGLPIGIQVVARPWREDIVLAIMHCLERQWDLASGLTGSLPAASSAAADGKR